MEAIRTVEAVQYVTPLREGGSLPAVVVGDDGEKYVMKFAGAGQGKKALIAELISGEIARALGLAVPEIAFITLSPELPPSEPDPEIQELMEASVGLNLGLKFLPEAFGFDPLEKNQVDPLYASKVVWLDAFTLNVDRTPRNTNMLHWQGQIWLIDHGASLYFHHNWNGYERYIASTFPLVSEHVLLPFASQMDDANRWGKKHLSESLFSDLVESIPEVWIDDGSENGLPEELKERYLNFLVKRFLETDPFVEEAKHARKTHV